MLPIILSGGSGTRLWPVSRAHYPKQFCEFYDQSFLKNTLERLTPHGSPLIITVEDMKALTEKTLQEMDSSGRVIYEPYGKNTAPAVALICHLLTLQGQEEEVIGIFPADHLITNTKAFHKALYLAEQCALKGQVVTLGIQPRYAATGYGYIEVEDRIFCENDYKAYFVKGFHEKPSREKAETFIRSGHHYWNAGMFVFQVKKMAELFDQLMPELWSKIQQVKEDLSNLKIVYANVESISLDYGIMEKLQEQVCIPCDIGWSDVGSWDEIARLADEVPELKQETRAIVSSIDSLDNYVFSLKNKVVGLVGVDNLIVVDTPDALLISKKGESQKVKDLVEAMRNEGLPEVMDHPFETRPWGRFEILYEGDKFKVKKITIDEGRRLSYQSHKKRSEYWTIVQGCAEVTLDDKVRRLEAGESITIPLQAKHRISNVGKGPLVFVEVQTGEYLGEDDIVRYQDDYGRN
ncbi:MAG: mannose-1-phosphate guanylyltransferase/mannose-6-phosphate isomerase [Bdellovibrio sp.]|nr:MAG: mannose-1-phosphate guanylyltransferase/mannose-6-phosphate isomerase [Bdellovibrio sp.]